MSPNISRFFSVWLPSFTHSPTHSLTHSLTHSFTHSLTQDDAVISLFHKGLSRPTDRQTDRPTERLTTRPIELLRAAKNLDRHYIRIFGCLWSSVTKIEMSTKLKYHQNLNVTKTEMSAKMKCHQN